MEKQKFISNFEHVVVFGKDDAIINNYAKDGDGGIDLVAVSKEYDSDGNVVYGTGLAFEIPYGYVGLLFPRSSNAKQEIILSNSVGVIDSGFRGQVIMKFKPIVTYIQTGAIKNQDIINYNIGDKIGQLIIMPYPQVKLIEVTELSDSDRGTGSYGSTGK